MVTRILSAVRDFAHAVLPLVGVATAASAIVATFVAHLGIPAQTTMDVLGAAGVFATTASKFIDSKSWTTITTDAQAWASTLERDAAAAARAAGQALHGNLAGAAATVAPVAAELTAAVQAAPAVVNIFHSAPPAAAPVAAQPAPAVAPA